ncbi:FAD dependent oxidoreductase, partial [Oesophagostomum dentatum]
KNYFRTVHADRLAELNKRPPSALPSRKELLDALKNGEEYDVLIIGGGATGAGVALDAQTRGLKTALVELDDFASGTSSRSTKLIHGGVRYLQAAIMKADLEQYRMVKEALFERANLLEIAPHLSAPLPIMLPIYKYVLFIFVITRYFMIKKVGGLSVLEADSTLARNDAHSLTLSIVNLWKVDSASLQTISYLKSLLDFRFPMLKSESLKGALIYYDGTHNDARMNLAIVLTAIRHGAKCVNHTRVESLLKDENGKITGARVKDTMTGAEWDIKAKSVVNATGPSTDTIRLMADPDTKPICVPSSGVHIVLPGYYSPSNTGLLDPDTSDGRVIFFLPWERMTIAGTTDAPSEVTLSPVPTDADVEFILKVAQHLANTYGDRAFVVARMCKMTGKRWPIIGNRLHQEFPYLDAEVDRYNFFGFSLYDSRGLGGSVAKDPTSEVRTKDTFLQFWHTFSITEASVKFQEHHQKIDERVLHELLNEVDLNKNGEIEIAEFFQLYSGLKGGQISANRLVRYLDEMHGTPSVSRSGGGV